MSALEMLVELTNWIERRASASENGRNPVSVGLADSKTAAVAIVSNRQLLIEKPR
jgi:hypothetical protein